VDCLAFAPNDQTLASGSRDGIINLWETATGRLRLTIKAHEKSVTSVIFDSGGSVLVSGSEDKTIKSWDTTTGGLIRTIGAYTHLSSVALDPKKRILAGGGSDNTVRLWEMAAGRLLRTLEGHTSAIDCIDFSSDSRLIASKSNDDTIRMWRGDTYECVAVIPVPKNHTRSLPGMAFHPTLHMIAAVGSSPEIPEGRRDRIIHIWNFDPGLLLAQPPNVQTSHYVNAKVVLLGDTGVGKSGLSLVLNGQPYEKTDSTPGRKVWTFQSQEVELDGHRKQTRETLLWDLAGQPGYRVIHQLHLNEVAVALVVFDSRSETDPLAGVRHWERAVRLAQQRQGSASVLMKKFLVSARTDRGTVSVSKERLTGLLEEFGFEGYFETSAKEGWQIKDLRLAIEQAIDWIFFPRFLLQCYLPISRLFY